MSSGKACDTCVCRAVCFWQRPYRERAVTGLDCGPGLPHWRGDDAAVLKAARLVIEKFDACACDDVRKIYFYSPFWHAVGELRTALAERGQR